MSAASSSFAAGPNRHLPPMMMRSQLATIVSGVPTAGELFPSPKAAPGDRKDSPAAFRRTHGVDTAKPQDLFPSPPSTPTAARQQNGSSGEATDEAAAGRDGGRDATSPEGELSGAGAGRHTPATAGSDYRPPPMRRVEDAFEAAPDAIVSMASVDGAAARDAFASGARSASLTLWGSLGVLQSRPFSVLHDLVMYVVTLR